LITYNVCKTNGLIVKEIKTLLNIVKTKNKNLTNIFFHFLL
jgi:hypothetical protein